MMSTTMLATTMNAAPIRTVAEMMGRSLVPIACRRGQADPLDVEDPLGEDRAGEQVGELEAEDRHHGDDRRPQGVLEVTRRSLSPLARAVRT